MRPSFNLAIFLCLLGVTAASAQTQNPQPASADSLHGMDMNTPASAGQSTSSGQQMDMSQCKMKMTPDGGKPMETGNGAEMNMCTCMMMMHGAAHHADRTPIPPGALRMNFGDQTKDWMPATLAGLPLVSVTVYNEHTKANETYSGVPLIALLTPLGVSDKPHGKDLRLYIVASGSDGYEAVYSSGEITPELNSSTVIVADLENGKPLAGDGPFKLIATNEKRPARWVRNLVTIKVFAAE